MTRKVLILSGVAAILAVGGASYAYAERGHGPMGGPGMMGGGMMGARFCAADEPFAPRILDRMERRIQPTDAQKPEFDALKVAAAKAEQQLKAACPTEAERADMTPPGRLNLAEKRMSAGLEALRTIKAPFDALYAKLDDKQRDRMRWAQRGWGEHGGGWRGHDWGDGR